MKTWQIMVVVAAVIAAFTQVAASQAADASKTVPKYDVTAEVKLKGTITDISERNCPISGTMGFHFMLKSGEQTIEIHVATSKFMKNYEVVLKQGDEVTVIGSKVKFAGEDTILAREVTHGEEVFVFRDKTGKPVW